MRCGLSIFVLLIFDEGCGRCSQMGLLLLKQKGRRAHRILQKNLFIVIHKAYNI